jgi:hypothetical protein
VAIATVRADVHESLDVHRDFSAESSLYAEVLLDRLTEAIGVRVIEIANALFGIDASLLENALRGRAANSEDVGQPDFQLLLAWKIHACRYVPFISALTLLVLWISAANDPNHALALDHLAVLADRLDAASYFPTAPYVRANPRVWSEGFLELAFEIKGLGREKQGVRAPLSENSVPFAESGCPASEHA